ncbi:hypothetical protein [Pedobacter sp. MC2016-24]|uniref:hypothetical protein n=1 Tax=Pedobacter sp. MC2016-24 TaxID=2780090 RepID=UPI001880AF18|nr:hypothetical protein [Pedobacter sp. MC2016-24]MBE9597952.1 hypothetical protein [Pedobacter sp. MC2016-24]
MTRSELVKESAIACLKRLNISFNKISEPEYHENKVIQLLNGHTATAALWVVHYTYSAFQEEDAFIYLDDRYFELIYIITPHGFACYVL